MSFIETEETLVIETPERVELEFALASIGNRFLAVLIDHTIQFFSIFSLYHLFVSFNVVVAENIELSEMPKWILALAIISIFFLFTSYFIFFEWLWNGQTPGKRLMRLRVIREDGRPITFWEAATRNILRIVDAFPGFILPIYSLGLIVIFFNYRDQRIGDIFAGTVVVRERVEDAPTFREVLSDSLGDASFLRVCKPVRFQADIGKLRKEELDVVRAFLQRRLDIEEKQRLWLAWRIALPIMYKLKPRYELENFTYEGFLEELFHLYNQRKKDFD
ncbi:MAG: RDD family protein [Pyrinomonadaceae bacterium]|nr:RDD family protein [Pyrinomonadaceae bacterium]MCX7640114.1 RDD family protein [Pyrinomonadaceae bacterium]MDW8303298.1 RDD family protein [Acidobacteriota bacterium]